MTDTRNKWTSRFFIDLAERVGATFVGALLALVTLTGQTPIDWGDGEVVWITLGVPTVVSLLKGLLANLADPETGASLVPDAPPGPRVNNQYGYAVLGALGLGLVILAVILAVANLLGALVVSWFAVIVVGVIGLVLLFVDGGVGRRVR